MQPEVWSQWPEWCAATSMTHSLEDTSAIAADEAMQWGVCSQWERQEFSEAEAWKFECERSALGFQPELEPWQCTPFGNEQVPAVFPQTLASAQSRKARKLSGEREVDVGQRASSLASPIRVPLPEPCRASAALPEFALELTGLDENAPMELPALLEPQKIDPPSSFQQMPGPPAPDIVAATASKPLKPASLGVLSPEQVLPHGMSVNSKMVGSTLATHIEWRIEDFGGRLQASMGKPLVSPPFTACGLQNLRLMVFPDAREAVKSARSRDRRGMYAAMVKKGPLYGGLKLKAECLGCATDISFNLSVGSIGAGPVTYDFSQQAVHGLDDFGVDWLKQVDKATGSLVVSADILYVKPRV